MAQPTAWSPSQNYAIYASQHASSPFPPASLDTDFANLRLTLQQTLANLAIIQRDDTGLSNGIVTPSSLATATLNLIGEWTPLGDWVTATRYAVRDMVTVGSVSYVCCTAHASDASFALDLARGYWQPINGLGSAPLDGTDIQFTTNDVILGRATAGAGDGEEIPFTSVARQLSDDTTFAAMRATLGLVIGTNVQAFDLDLSALAALTGTGFAQRTGANTWALAAGVGMAIGSAIASGTVGDVLFVGAGPVLAQNNYFVFDTANYRLGIAQSTPTETLHVGGNARFDNSSLHAINLYLGNTLSNTDGALIQYADSSVVGYGAGAVLCGLGFTNAAWGWADDRIILSSGTYLGFTGGNIQADITADATITRLGADHLGTGLLTVKRTNEAWTDLGTNTTFAINFAVGGTFRINPSANFTLTFTNLPAAGKSARVVIEVDNASGFTGTYPAGFIWSAGTEPTWSANVDLATIYVSGDNATYFGMQSFEG